MTAPGAHREGLSAEIAAAYRDGLLSEQTFTHRVETLLGARLIDPARLVGDLSARSRHGALRTGLRERLRGWWTIVRGREADGVTLLALDWTGAAAELVVGRERACDVVLDDLSVSRRDARLRFRDGVWTVHDLGSTNGTRVNRVAVGRCRLQAGDRISFGDRVLQVD